MKKLKKYLACVVLLTFSSQVSGAVLLLQRSHQTVVAVTNFIHAGDNANTDYLQQAIPQAVTRRLNANGRLQALVPDQAGTGSQGFEAGLPEPKMLSQIGQSLQAQTVLTGEFVSIGSMVKIDIRLLDVESGEPLLEQSQYLLEGQDLSTLAQELAESVEVALLGETPPAESPVDESRAANELANQSSQSAPEPAPAPSVTAAGASITSQWWYWVLLGAGVAGGIYGIHKLIQSDANTSTVTIDFPLP